VTRDEALPQHLVFLLRPLPLSSLLLLVRLSLNNSSTPRSLRLEESCFRFDRLRSFVLPLPPLSC
jgi:hypothetical protein